MEDTHIIFLNDKPIVVDTENNKGKKRQKKNSDKNALCKGKVTNCQLLNVRAAASKNSKVLCTLRAGTVVTIDAENNGDEFYGVVVNDGIHGFCMKQFISLN